jgi:hypothetical protein
MTILQANLKHLYQRKGCWLISLALALFALPAIEALCAGRQSAFLMFPVWMYVAAIFTAPLQIEVMTKPFSWCLPGHARIPARFLFCAGICGSLFWSAIFLIFLMYPAATLAGRLLISVSVFFTATIIYWLGVWIVFRFSNWANAIALFPLALLAGHYLGLERLLEIIVVDQWYSMVLLGAVVNFLAWRGLSVPGLARKYCGRLWLGAFDAWNKEKMSQFTQARLARKKKELPSVVPHVEKFFLDRISRRPGMNTSQVIWGGLYRSFGLIIASRKKDWLRFIVVILPIICFLGYMSPAANMLFIMPGLMVIHISLGVRSSLLISGGRKERFWSAMILALVTAMSITALITLIAALTLPLQAIMPELTIKGQSVIFKAMELRLFIVPLLMIPVTFSFALIFHKHPRLMFACVIMLFLLLVRLSVFLRVRPILPEQPGPIHLLIALLCCWAIFTAVLHDICKRRCLLR